MNHDTMIVGQTGKMYGIITMKDRKNYTVLSTKDLFYLARKYGGEEFASVFEKTLELFDNDCAEARKDLQSLIEERETMQDHYTQILRNIREEAEALEDLLSSKRLNREKLKKGVFNIWKMTNDEL